MIEICGLSKSQVNLASMTRLGRVDSINGIWELSPDDAQRASAQLVRTNRYARLMGIKVPFRPSVALKKKVREACLSNDNSAKSTEAC